MRRRQFLTISATALGGVLVFTLDRALPLPRTKRSQDPRPAAIFRGAACADDCGGRRADFPQRSLGPGAAEAGVVIYIDRQLARPYGSDRYRYTQPPFEEGHPEQGYQGKATPRQIYREGLTLLGQ